MQSQNDAQVCIDESQNDAQACIDESKTLPYRTTLTEESDKKYASRLLSVFNEINNEKLRRNFNRFTSNLMEEQYINRFDLLEAIDDYVATFKIPEKCGWMRFSDTAFNYRPYQSMYI